jgi:hypothetical protein
MSFAPVLLVDVMLIFVSAQHDRPASFLSHEALPRVE